LDATAAEFRVEMVERLRELGVRNESVLEAMGRVPRHRFVERFWVTGPGVVWNADNVEQHVVTDDSADEVLRWVYNPQVALVTRGPTDIPAATAYGDGTTFTGLRPGTYLTRVVPVNTRLEDGPSAQTTFVVP